MSTYSINNKLVVEAYDKDAQLRSTIKNGIAVIEQTILLKGLKVFVSTKLSDGTYIEAGSMVYIKEKLLHESPWAKVKLRCDTFSGEFMIIDSQYVEFIEPPKPSAA